jgi:hypothetical protein
VLGRRWLSLLLLALVAVVWPSRASAWTSANAQTRVGVFDVAAHAVVGLASARSPGNHRAPSLARSQLASDNALAAEGLEAAAVNGNSLASTNAQHVYEILRTDAAGSVDVYKWGISGGPTNAAGLSVRAETQVSALNRAANGAYTYESSIVQAIPGGAGARGAALSLERQLVYDYFDLVGRKPFGNLRP